MMIIAQENKGLVIERVFADYCQRLKIGRSAVRTAQKFYVLFKSRVAPSFTFPARITNEDIFLAYLHYKKGNERIKFFDLLNQGREHEVALTDVLADLKAKLEKSDEDRAAYFNKWEDALEERDTYHATATDLRNRLTKTERLIESLQRSFSDIIKGMTEPGEEEAEPPQTLNTSW
jgi:hypothetical protein